MIPKWDPNRTQRSTRGLEGTDWREGSQRSRDPSWPLGSFVSEVGFSAGGGAFDLGWAQLFWPVGTPRLEDHFGKEICSIRPASLSAQRPHQASSDVLHIFLSRANYSDASTQALPLHRGGPSALVAQAQRVHHTASEHLMQRHIFCRKILSLCPREKTLHRVCLITRVR